MNTLVVEPSITYRLIFNEFLYGFSISPEDVITGAEALVSVQNQHYDLICITMHLPDMSGVELAKKIREIKGSENTVIVLLSSEQNEVVRTKLQTKAVNYVCHKMALDDLKNLFVKITQDELVTCQCEGNILYIEDHMTLAKVTMAMLAHMGLTVEHHTSAESGLDAIENKTYDLVILDIILSGKKDGVDFISELRKRQDEKRIIPILAISSALNDSQRIRVLKVGANDFIHKPVIEAELAARLKNMLFTQQLYQQVKLQKQELERMALTDQLTGLYNRHFLMDYVDKALSTAKRHQYPLSIVMIDLDKFKQINDQLGHEKGDKLLCDIAKVLKGNCRDEDAAVRLGGDEFLLVLPYCSLEQAINKAEIIRQEITLLEPYDRDTSASFGLCSTEANSFVFDELFLLADKAVYQAKSKGGNRVCSGCL